MVNFPASLDSLSNPTALTKRNDPGFELHTVISTLNDIAEQLEAKLGVGAANQSPASAGTGRVLVIKADGTTEWLALGLGNALVDGGFERWPFAISIAVPASTTTVAGYGGGNFCLRTGANQACHIDQVAGLTNGSQWASRVRRDSGQTGTGVLVYEQPFTTEDIIRFALRGQLCSLVATVKGGANWSPASGNLSVRVAAGTAAQARRGGGFTSETTLINQTTPVAAGGSNVLLAFTSGVIVPTTTTQMSASFEWTPSGTAGAADDITIDDVALVAGPVTIPFLARFDDDKAFTRRARKLGGSSVGDIGMVANGTAGVSLSHSLAFEEMVTTPATTKVGTWTVSNCAQPVIIGVGRSSLQIGAAVTATNWAQWQTVDTTTYIALESRF
jgi:hypothetical protein